MLSKQPDGLPGNKKNSTGKSSIQGIASGIGSYALWGFLPLYWGLLRNVNSIEILFHRMVWAFVFMVVLCSISKINILTLLRDNRMRRYLFFAGLLVSVNWGIYIYAVTNGEIVAASLGYYINPLVSILLGVLFFEERLSRAQIVATIMAIAGVLVLAVSYGSLPWIPLILAVTFGIYGLIKKKAGYEAVPSLAVETSLMAPFALVGLIILAVGFNMQSFLVIPLTAHGAWISALLVIGGVLTALPLILFATAANNVPLSVMGFLQYISPTISLIIGVFVNHEPFTWAHGVCFTLIWVGIALILIEAGITARPTR